MRIQIDDILNVRSFRTDDYIPLAKRANNEKVAINLRDAFPNPYTQQDAKEWIELATSSSPETHFAITNNNECIGCIGLTLQEDIFSHSAEIGFWIGEDFWGKGIATLAAKALINYGFIELSLDRIFAYVYSSNIGSIRVLEKCGLNYEGKMVRGAIKQGLYIDLLQYAVLNQQTSK
ncbi:MAG: GNAT family N-acetyltransferase [Bacteroidetes bacterium]|nr:GNAT family N-acetyltransferase [Bacteroidota bacterium]